MKKLICITVCATLLLSCSPKRPAVIERPVFDSWSSTVLEIDKIEMNDSATTIYFDVHYRPGARISVPPAACIRPSGTAEALTITGAEGVTIGEDLTIPESGTVSIKLFFPPLKPEITKIDYIEGDNCDNCFNIWGINLMPGAKVTFDPVPQEFADAALQPLPAPGYSTQPAKLSGRLSGFVEGMAPNAVILYATNILDGDRTETKAPIAGDGSFNGEITPGMTGIVMSSIGPVFLIPGKEVKMYTDLKKRSRYESRYRTDKEPGDSIYTYIAGSCFSGADLDAITQASRGLFDYQKLMQETVNMKPGEFKQHVLGIMNQKLDEVKQKNYPANTQMMVENSIKIETYAFLMQYEGFINAAYMRVNNIKSADRDKITFKPEKPGIEYYSYLKDGLNDNMSYLPNYLYLTEALGYVDYFNLPGGEDKPAKERFAYFKDKLSPVLGTDKGMLFDIVKAHFYGSQIRDMKLYTDAEKQEMRDAFKDQPAYAEKLIAESDRLAAAIAANKENKESILNEPPKVSQEKMFDAILAKYKGKVVVVDFWATWCGPCMQAMKAIHPLKDELKGKDVVFLYLTGETSPLNTWMQAFPSISGEHYRVSQAQWNHWSKIFAIQAIPTYMVYNRQGKQETKYTGFPGVEKIKEDIEKAI